MNDRILRVSQLGGAAGLLALGGFLAVRVRDDPASVAFVVGLVAVGLFPCALLALAESSGVQGGARSKAPEASVDSVLDQVVGLIRRFLSVQTDYQENLTGLNAGLSQFPSRNEVQDIIVKLMNRNMEMQEKVSDLSRDLEASQLEIVNLRSNVTEVGKIAMVDSLTELGNRRFFDQTLSDEVTRANTAGSELCLAMADLDRFKAVNDRFGHIVGDHLLRLFAELISHHTKDKGVAARYGGEEFALLFPNTSIDRATAIVERIRRELETKRWVVGAKEDRLGAVTASFGVARLARNEDGEALVARADAKLFEAKAAGRNRVASERTPESASAPPPARAASR